MWDVREEEEEAGRRRNKEGRKDEGTATNEPPPRRELLAAQARSTPSRRCAPGEETQPPRPLSPQAWLLTRWLGARAAGCAARRGPGKWGLGSSSDPLPSSTCRTDGACRPCRGRRAARAVAASRAHSESPHSSQHGPRCMLRARATATRLHATRAQGVALQRPRSP
jgi:hypothetical protein